MAGVLLKLIVIVIMTVIITLIAGLTSITAYAWAFIIGLVVLAVALIVLDVTSRRRRTAAPSVEVEDVTSSLDRLAKLHDSGKLSDAEFAAAKRNVLGSR